jgi:site-specific recombinase XerD
VVKEWRLFRARNKRHSLATHLLEAGYNFLTIQEIMGHKNVNTTMIYTHVARKSYSDISSALDKL